MTSAPEEIASPAVAPAADDSSSCPVILRYSKGIWTTLLDRLRIPFLDSQLLPKIAWPSLARRHRRRNPSLPLPLPRSTSQISPATASRTSAMLQDIMECILRNLHIIQKSLQFWQSRAEGTSSQKIYFMIFERGPCAFLSGTFELLSRLGTNGSPFQHIFHGASNTISLKKAILMSLRHSLANFLAQIYLEANKYEKLMIEDADVSLPLLLLSINELFLKLEVSMSHSHEIAKDKGFPLLDNSGSSELHFENIPHVEFEKSQWTDNEIRDAIDMTYQNLRRFESHLALFLSTCQKPKRLTIYWLHYTCGAVGLSLCSLWLLRHSRLMGSSDIDNWIHEAKESAAIFLKEHVEQPLISIRDDLFETFRRRDKGVMETGDVALTSKSLHRMLLAFCEKTKGQKLQENIPDQEMLKMVMARYEKEVMHPLQNLLSGELARAMLIQIQKLKLDLETAMLELDQILKANEINFAILAALPAFFLSLLLLMFVRAWLKKDKSAEGRGRVARRQRRLLVVEAEKRLVEFQTCIDQGKEDDARCMYGLMLYTLDSLYKAVERHARETGEWISLRQDIVDLAKPDLKTDFKLVITSRMGLMYDCLLPSLRRQ